MRTTKSKSQILFENSKQIYFNSGSLTGATRIYNNFISSHELIDYSKDAYDIIDYVVDFVYKKNAYNINLDYIKKFINLSYYFFNYYSELYKSNFLFPRSAFKSFLRKIIFHNIFVYDNNLKCYVFVPFDFEDYFTRK